MSTRLDSVSEVFDDPHQTVVLSSVERLALTRARLRQAMLPPSQAAASEPSAYASLLGRFMKQPSVASIIDALSGWWSRHPIRPLANLAGDAAKAVAKPIAQHNPIALVAAAALFGIAVTWLRPWRWALRSALFAGLAPQLISRVVSSLPLESWLAAFTPAAGAPAGPAEPHRKFQ